MQCLCAFILLWMQILLWIEMTDSLFIPPSVNRRRGRNPHPSHYLQKRCAELSFVGSRQNLPSFSRGRIFTLLLETMDDREDMSLLDNTLTSTDLESVEAAVATNDTATKKGVVQSSAQATPPKTKWKADNYERDYQLLQNALARDNAISNLQQLRRKYTLDHGFTRRPLFKDALNVIMNVSGWVALLMSCSRAGMVGWAAWNASTSARRKLCMLLTESVMTVVNLHYWVVVMALPLLLLAWAKSEEPDNVGTKNVSQQYKRRRPIQRLFGDFGPTALELDAYFKDPWEQSAPSFFYSTDRSRKRDTKDFVQCLLENWSSAVVASFIWRTLSIISSLVVGTAYKSTNAIGKVSGAQVIPIVSRLITRLGAAAALNQYPSLLFELRRKDQPRPLCRSTVVMQRAVGAFIHWLRLGISVDLALLLTSLTARQHIDLSSLFAGFLFSVIGPVCHITAFMRLIRISKSNNLSWSDATSFPMIDCITAKESKSNLGNPHEIKWRYELLWRTPQRISVTLQTWITYFVTNHKPLLFELDEWKSVIRHDGFSTEGFKFQDQSEVNDDLLVHTEEIMESLSLIRRDRDAAINNATQARFTKHQESYDRQELDDVLGVAVQQTFGIGLSYDFEHFNTPLDDNNISIHQLRARLAKSAIREKKRLEKAMAKELKLLRNLRGNVSTDMYDEITKREITDAEKDIRNRYNFKLESIKSSLMRMIPTNAGIPEGIENSFDSPIMVAEYVNLTAPIERRDLKATVLEAPDPLLAVEEYTRMNFGDQAADAYRKNELAFRRKERELLKDMRQKHGDINASHKD